MSRPRALPVQPQSIPEELKAWPQWVCWRWELRDGKWTKIPVDAGNREQASSTDPDTWSTFGQALAYSRRRRLAGIGYVFGHRDPFAGADLDNCRDPETGAISPWALEIVRLLDSYTEVSPSSSGLKVFVRATLPPGRKRRGNIEMYDRGRYFTTTGHHLSGTPATALGRQAELTALHRRVFGGSAAQQRTCHGGGQAAGSSLEDQQLLELAMNATNGEKFRRLWSGDTSEYATQDNAGRSEADLALCSILAFWCGPDPERIDSLFRRSGLYRPKWERADYRASTIAAALDRSEFYQTSKVTHSRSKARRVWGGARRAAR
jgi:putative DNA primase/helicase